MSRMCKTVHSQTLLEPATCVHPLISVFLPPPSPTAGGEIHLLPGVSKEVQFLNQSAHQFAFDIIFVGLLRKLNQIPSMKVGIWMTLCGCSAIVCHSGAGVYVQYLCIYVRTCMYT